MGKELGESTRRIAICAEREDENGSTFDLFERSPYYCMAEKKNGRINYSFPEFPHCVEKRLVRLSSKGIEALVTMKISGHSYNYLANKGIEVYQGNGIVEEVAIKYFAGNLTQLLSGTIHGKVNCGRHNNP